MVILRLLGGDGCRGCLRERRRDGMSSPRSDRDDDSLRVYVDSDRRGSIPSRDNKVKGALGIEQSWKHTLADFYITIGRLCREKWIRAQHVLQQKWSENWRRYERWG